MAPRDDLALAREHLAKAESTLATENGLHPLQEGLALLEAALVSKPSKQTESVATNLGRTYTNRIYERIGREVEKPNLSEPELEHLFAVIRAFDDAPFDLPSGSRNLKVSIVRRLIDLYYEGYTSSEKEAVLAKLAVVSHDSGEVH